jgi:acyl-CoA reductase-like NAD-dependent aldehyde dehydrogenase
LTLWVTNPATGKRIGQYREMSPQSLEARIAAADKAFRVKPLL